MKYFSLLLVMTFCLQGCSVISTGRKVPLDVVDSFKEGETTPEDVKAALGEPEDVTINTLDETMVFIYKRFLHRSLGIGIPPWFIVARKSDNGFQLNVAFMNGIFRGYTLTSLKQNIFWKKKKKE